MADDPILSGQLGLISLFDLAQLLMLNGATGEVVILQDSGKGYFYFERGQIVNAIDDQYREGEGAAYRLFSWKSGPFEFRAKPATGTRAISESTEGLMMEAARRMDEQGGGESGGEAEKLARRAGNLELLREAFLSVASDAQGGAGGEGDPNSPLALLRAPEDALLLRPGHAPRVRHAGRWRDAGGEALTPTGYDQLRLRLLEDPRQAVTAPATSSGVRSHVAAQEGGARYVVTRLEAPYEAMWVRAAGLAPPGPAQLDGPIDALEQLLSAPSGLLLVGGPDAECADRLLHACVAHHVRRRGETVVLLADHDRWEHSDELGAVIRATRATLPELLRAVAPGAAAFDAAHADASAAATGSAPFVLAAVVAPDAAAMLARWCSRVGRRWGDGIEALLAGATVGLVHSPHSSEDGRVLFEIARVRSDVDAGPGTPAAAASGPVSGSTPAPTVEPVAAPATGGRKDPMAALAAELKRTLRKAA
jgi:hypothetical protein